MDYMLRVKLLQIRNDHVIHDSGMVCLILGRDWLIIWFMYLCVPQLRSLSREIALRQEARLGCSSRSLELCS